MSNLNIKAIEELVANVLGTRFESFDEAMLENAKDRIIDTVGCLIAGANAPGNLELVDLVKDWGGKEEATILIHGSKAPAQNAAMVNSIMVRSFDCEPNGVLVDNILIPSHISGTTVPTTLTMGETLGASGKELITAMLVGEDLEARILAATRPGKRIDMVGTVNVFGATAIAGRLLGLNEFQLRNALGIALIHLAGSYQNLWDRTLSFKLPQGLSARNGIFSAQLAKRGWTATEDPLFGRFAYYYLYSEDLTNVEILTKDLGKKYYTEAHFKPYPSCRANDAPIECALSLTHKHQIETADIKEVIVSVSRRPLLEMAVGRPFNIGDFSYVKTLFSYQYAVASALLNKSVTPEHFLAESMRDPEINALISKIKLAELSTTELLAARIDVITNDGRELSECVEVPKGDQARNPMSKDEIIAKFWDNVDFSKTVTKKNATELLRLLDRAEEVSNLNKIVKLLVV